MKILLVGDDPKIAALIRSELKGKDAVLRIAKSVRAAENYLQKERPEVVVFGIMDEGNSITPDQIENPKNYQVGHDFWQFDLNSRSLVDTAAESAAYFLRNLPIPNAPSRPKASSLVIKDGKVELVHGSKPSKQIAKKAQAANQSLAEAREALAGIASFEEDPGSIGNRVPTPLTREVINTIERALDASIASTASPVVGKEVVEYWRATAAFLKDAERAIRQVEKTATAGIKAAGVLGILAATLGAAVLKLRDLVAALGLGG